MKSTLVKIINYLTLILFTIVILYPLIFFVQFYYKEFIKFIFINYENRSSVEFILDSSGYRKLFEVAKILVYFIFVWVLSVWVDFFTFRKSNVSKIILKFGNFCFDSIRSNRNVLLCLTKKTRVILFLVLLIQAISFLYYLFNVPLHYDEWWSYRFFSSKGIWQSLSFYPLPNNHVLYNIIASIFVKLPFDQEITMRLPSYFAAIIATYFFFKICVKVFSENLSLLLLCLIIMLQWFISYSIQARGYSFINLFIVLIIYCLTHLSEQYNARKYRFILIGSMVSGLLSVPSFLYALFPVFVITFLYVLKQKSKRSIYLFFSDGFFVLVFTLLTYASILCFNKPGNLINPNNGNTKFSLNDAGVFQKIVDHLNETFKYLFFNLNILPLLAILILITVVYFLVTSPNNFLITLSATIFFSPVIILFIHKVFPFERTWLYLIFPTVLCFGYILQVLLRMVSKIPVVKNIEFNHIGTFSAAFVLLTQSTFINKNKRSLVIDYEIKTTRDRFLDSKLAIISKIGFTNVGIEYYPAEVISFVCYKNFPKRQVELQRIDSSVVLNHDILFIQNWEIDKYRNKLSNYDSLYTFEANISLFFRKP
jgi:hypothetical protein